MKYHKNDIRHKKDKSKLEPNFSKLLKISFFFFKIRFVSNILSTKI